jgi:hypothetical protein
MQMTSCHTPSLSRPPVRRGGAPSPFLPHGRPRRSPSSPQTDGPIRPKPRSQQAPRAPITIFDPLAGWSPARKLCGLSPDRGGEVAASETDSQGCGDKQDSSDRYHVEPVEPGDLSHAAQRGAVMRSSSAASSACRNSSAVNPPQRSRRRREPERYPIAAPNTRIAVSWPAPGRCASSDPGRSRATARALLRTSPRSPTTSARAEEDLRPQVAKPNTRRRAGPRAHRHPPSQTARAKRTLCNR